MQWIDCDGHDESPLILPRPRVAHGIQMYPAPLMLAGAYLPSILSRDSSRERVTRSLKGYRGKGCPCPAAAAHCHKVCSIEEVDNKQRAGELSTCLPA